MNDSSPPSRESSRLRPLLVGIVALAAVLRMAYYVERRAELDFDRPLIDAAWHHWWAVGWATGDWSDSRLHRS